MYCTWCRKEPNFKNAFVKGSKNFQRSALDEHIVINDHQKASKKHDPILNNEVIVPEDNKTLDDVVKVKRPNCNTNLCCLCSGMYIG